MNYQCPTPDCALHLSGAAFPAPMPCPVCKAPLVEVQVADEPSASRSDFEQRVLDRYPYVIALPYRNMLVCRGAADEFVTKRHDGLLPCEIYS